MKFRFLLLISLFLLSYHYGISALFLNKFQKLNKIYIDTLRDLTWQQVENNDFSLIESAYPKERTEKTENYGFLSLSNTSDVLISNGNSLNSNDSSSISSNSTIQNNYNNSFIDNSTNNLTMTGNLSLILTNGTNGTISFNSSTNDSNFTNISSNSSNNSIIQQQSTIQNLNNNTNNNTFLQNSYTDNLSNATSNQTQNNSLNNTFSSYFFNNSNSNDTNYLNNTNNISENSSNSSSNFFSTHNDSLQIEKITNNLSQSLKTPKDISNETQNYLKALKITNKTTISIKSLEKPLKKYKKLQNIQSKIRSGLIIDSENELLSLKRKISENTKINKIIDSLQDYNNCSIYTNCSSCTNDLTCGWCPTLNLCIIGNNEGPYLGKCEDYQYSLCRGTGCLRFEDCYSCLSDSSCGWCSDESKGFASCIEGSASFEACSRESWYHALRVEGRYNHCNIVSYGPSDDQLIRKEQYRLWENNQITKKEMLKRKGREIRDELGYIPNKKQIEEFKKEDETRKNRLKKVLEIEQMFSLRKKPDFFDYYQEK